MFVAGPAIGIRTLGVGRGTMAAFDAGAATFLAMVSRLFRRGKAEQMRREAKANDANRAVLLAFTAVTSIVILAAVDGELKGQNDAVAVTLVVSTLATAWLFSNTVYALHYADMYYLKAHDEKDAGGIDFPKCEEPDYGDFLYFSYTLGMTFQTSDVDITARAVRRVAIGQCLAAFVFDLGVLAFTINVLGG